MKDSMDSNKVTLGGETVRMTISKVITLCVTMLTSMLLSRFRTYEEYGTYSQLLLVISLFSSIFMLGLPNSINFFLVRADTQEEKKKFLSIYYTMNTILSLVVGFVLVLSIPVFEGYFKNSLIGKFYYFLAIYPWSTIISSSIENLLVVYKKARMLIRYRVVNSIALLMPIVVVQYLNMGFSEYMIAFIVINAAFAIYVYIVAYRISGGIRPLLDIAMVKTILAFSVPIGLSSMVGTLNTEIDKLMIGYLMNTEQMAIYSNAAKELPIAIVPASITAVLLPQLTRMIKKDQYKEAVDLWGIASELAFIVICFLVSGIFTYAEDVMTILYSSKYLPGVFVFRVYTLNLLLRVTYFGILLNACGKTKKIFACSLVSLLLNVVLNPVLFWLMGMIGPAIATFLAILLTLLLQLKMTSILTKVPYAGVFPWKKVFQILCFNVVFSLLFWMVKHYVPLDIIVGSVIEGLLFGVIWGVCYFVVMRRRIQELWNRLNAGGQINETLN